MTLKSLAAAALRGTARSPLPALPPSPLGEALGRIQTASPEATLLARAALSGLHARAGLVLDAATVLPPVQLPPPACPLPPQLWALLPALLGTPLRSAVLDDLELGRWTLSAAQLLSLKNSGVRNLQELWPLLDERGQAVLDGHPLQVEWQKADAQAQWQARLHELQAVRTADPSAGAAQTLELWQAADANGRRDLLDLLEKGLLADDLPLLQHAETDRSAEVQRRVRMLQGHLPGPLQDELLALVPQVVTTKGDQLKFRPFQLPEALGTPNVGAVDDSDLHRLLGALPFSVLLGALDVRGEQLVQAAEKKSRSLGQQLRAQRERERPERSAEAQAPVTAADAAEWLASIQQRGQRDPATFGRLARQLDPTADIAVPQPLPFVMPARPASLSARQLALWEERQPAVHHERQAEAEAAWRSLMEVLRLRREWARALEEVI
ncbi:hypothetical protein GCM10017783_12390 [Deinococcus piscis]|uniref:Uncharacterized protein n=1 Tax=Deinococcus piscis TaxID=394230 RepID=A0ABQ3K7S8_9DEIO|nr:DUF5691 domain-containing protein [Deinococcus piscis]GHG01667.1 hypothetical protein GCM10017783_12390 [Deinococcus piscis]